MSPSGTLQTNRWTKTAAMIRDGVFMLLMLPFLFVGLIALFAFAGLMGLYLTLSASRIARNETRGFREDRAVNETS